MADEDNQENEGIKPETAREMSRLGAIFGLLQKAHLELADLASSGEIADAFTLGDSTGILDDVIRQIEDVRNANNELSAEFEAGLEAGETNADNTLHALRPKVSRR